MFAFLCKLFRKWGKRKACFPLHSLPAEIHSKINEYLHYDNLHTLSMTCRTERKNAIEHRRKHALSVLSTLFAELPVRGPMLRSQIYETAREGRPSLHTHIILSARVDPRTLNIVVTESSVGMMHGSVTWMMVLKQDIISLFIKEIPLGSVDEESHRWAKIDEPARELVENKFKYIHAAVASSWFDNIRDFVEIYSSFVTKPE